MNKGSIGKGAAYLYIEAIAMLFSGYLYWFILSTITTPSIVGMSSTVISLVTIFSAVASIGVAGGIQSFMGKNIMLNNKEQIKSHINSSIVILTLGLLSTIIAILIMNEWLYDHFQINLMLLVAAIAMMAVTVISAFFRALIIPSLNTQIITLSSILSTFIKILATILLVLNGSGPLGILVGFTMYPLVSLVIMFTSIRKTYYSKPLLSDGQKKIKLTFTAISGIFVSGIGFWIPGIINTIGSQLGTVLVFLSSGSGNAGIYFIALSIVTGISVIMSVLSLIAYPTISSMEDGRKRAVWKLTRLSLIMTIPLSNSLVFYSAQIMQIFGQQYMDGSSNLLILLLSIFPLGIINGVGVLAYSYGKHRQFLFIGLATSIPRVLLYIILVPFLGGNGAAMTYLIGGIIGAAWSIVAAKKMGLKLFWNQLVIIFTVPLLASAILNVAQVNFIIGIFITLLISYIIYVKLNSLDIEDIQDILRIIPPRVSSPMLSIITRVYGKLRRN